MVDPAIEAADELAVASITWRALAWLAHHERIVVNVPVRTWLDGLPSQLRTVGLTPANGAAAVALSASFPDDLADRIIFATALERGYEMVTKDSAFATIGRPGTSRSGSDRWIAYPSFTAVPDAVTISIEPLWPTVS